MSAKILLVEDDPSLQASIQKFLRDEGYTVELAGTLAAARSKQVGCNLVVLDWMLPDGQGIDYLKTLRYSGSQLPVILLTARTETMDKVLGLETGANDYLTKPFEPRELIARIRVQLRSLQSSAGQSGAHSERLSVGPITVDLQAREACFEGRLVTLTKMEFDLLKLLCENPNRVFSREELLNRVWGFENFPTTRTVDTHILQLRQKFGDARFETVRGIGYRLKN